MVAVVCVCVLRDGGWGVACAHQVKKKICLKALITIQSSVRDARPVPRDFFALKQAGTTTERFDMQCSQGMNLGNSGS